MSTRAGIAGKKICAFHLRPSDPKAELQPASSNIKVTKKQLAAICDSSGTNKYIYKPSDPKAPRTTCTTPSHIGNTSISMPWMGDMLI